MRQPPVSYCDLLVLFSLIDYFGSLYHSHRKLPQIRVPKEIFSGRNLAVPNKLHCRKHWFTITVVATFSDIFNLLLTYLKCPALLLLFGLLPDCLLMVRQIRVTIPLMLMILWRKFLKICHISHSSCPLSLLFKTIKLLKWGSLNFLLQSKFCVLKSSIKIYILMYQKKIIPCPRIVRLTILVSYSHLK